MAVDSSLLDGIIEEKPWTMFTVIGLGGEDRKQPQTWFALSRSAQHAAWITQKSGLDVVAVIPGVIDQPLSPKRIGVLDPSWMDHVPPPVEIGQHKSPTTDTPSTDSAKTSLKPGELVRLLEFNPILWGLPKSILRFVGKVAEVSTAPIERGIVCLGSSDPSLPHVFYWPKDHLHPITKDTNNG